MRANQTGIILLAAGASSRLGQPKQKLLYQGKSLLQHAAQEALQTGFQPVILVLGAHAKTIKPEVAGLPLQIILNPDWEEGMASSIRAGLHALLNEVPEVYQVILMVCDQPFVSSDLLKKLAGEKVNNPDAIIACAYQDTIGTPVLFPRRYFPELLALTGQAGAKKLLFRHTEAVLSIPFPEGNIDIDTIQDYEGLNQHHLKK